ncbi:MAG: S1 RNA-binding domain-containing protein [Dehalococcoidia bacterium]|jgi:predicted RNA-binding protein with RPS1 domain
MSMKKVVGITEADWDILESLRDQAAEVEATVTQIVKGGFRVVVMDSFSGFLPKSLSSIAGVSMPQVKEAFPCRIVETDREDSIIIVSRKEVLMQLRKEKAKEAVSTLCVGQLKDGVVKSCMDYGFFVAINEDIDGLLHFSNLGSLADQTFKVGDELKVRIVSIDRDNGKVSLGSPDYEFRARSHTPRFERKVGEEVAGRIVSIPAKDGLMDTGADVTLVRLKTGAMAKVPRSEINFKFEIGQLVSGIIAGTEGTMYVLRAVAPIALAKNVEMPVEASADAPAVKEERGSIETMSAKKLKKFLASLSHSSAQMDESERCKLMAAIARRSDFAFRNVLKGNANWNAEYILLTDSLS